MNNENSQDQRQTHLTGREAPALPFTHFNVTNVAPSEIFPLHSPWLFFFYLLLLPPRSPSPLAPVPWRRIQEVTPTLTSTQPHGDCLVLTHGCCVVWVLTCSELCCCSFSPLLSVKLSQGGQSMAEALLCYTALTSMAAVSLVGMRVKRLCLPGYQCCFLQC